MLVAFNMHVLLQTGGGVYLRVCGATMHMSITLPVWPNPALYIESFVAMESWEDIFLTQMSFNISSSTQCVEYAANALLDIGDIQEIDIPKNYFDLQFSDFSDDELIPTCKTAEKNPDRFATPVSD